MKHVYLLFLALFIFNNSIGQVKSLELNFDDFNMIKDEKLKKELKNVWGKLQYNLMILEESEKTIVFGSQKKSSQSNFSPYQYNTATEDFYTYAFDRATMTLKHALKHRKPKALHDEGTHYLFDINCKNNGDVVYYYQFSKYEKGQYFSEYYYAINDGEKIALKNSEYIYDQFYMLSDIAYSNNGQAWGITRTTDNSTIKIDVYQDLEWQFQKEIKLPKNFQNKGFNFSNPMAGTQFKFNVMISNDMKTIYLIKKENDSKSEKSQLEMLIYNCETNGSDERTITIDRDDSDEKRLFYSLTNKELHVFGAKSNNEGSLFPHLNNTLFYNVYSFPGMQLNTSSEVKISDKTVGTIIDKNEKSEKQLKNKNSTLSIGYFNYNADISTERYFYTTFSSKNYESIAKMIYHIDGTDINKVPMTFIIPQKIDTKKESFLFWEDKYYRIVYQEKNLMIYEDDSKSEKLIFKEPFSIIDLSQSLEKGRKSILVKDRKAYHYIAFSK